MTRLAGKAAIVTGAAKGIGLGIAQALVAAGAAITLVCAVSTDPVRDLRGRSVVIRDHTGATVARAELEGFDGQANQTGRFTVQAPVEPGDYTWSAELEVADDGEGADEGTRTDFSFTVEATELGKAGDERG